MSDLPSNCFIFKLYLVTFCYFYKLKKRRLSLETSEEQIPLTAQEIYNSLRTIAATQEKRTRKDLEPAQEIEELRLLLQKLCILLEIEYCAVHFGFLYNMQDEGGVFSDIFKKCAEGRLVMADCTPLNSSHFVLTKNDQAIKLEFICCGTE